MNQQNTHTLINILGAGRSGTTMLDLMLGNDDKSFSLGEIHAWFRPFRPHHKIIDCNCGDTQCPRWKKILYVSEKAFHAVAFKELEVDFLIDSSKSLSWVIDNNRWAKKRDIKVINIAMYKPLVSYIYSIWKRGESVDMALYRYKVYYSRLLSSGISVLTVSFADLVSHPDACLKRICRVTGQLYTEDRKEFWRRDHHHLFGSGGVREQSRSGLSRIEDREVYPEEFMILMDSVAEKIASDKEFQKIKKFLFDNNINENDECRYNASPVIRFFKPGWYYAQKAKSILRRRFPEKYTP